MDDKSTEKPTYALNGHGSGQKPPTTSGTDANDPLKQRKQP